MNRDLDAVVAEEIYGWKLISTGKDYYDENESFVLEPPEGFSGTFPPVGAIHKAYLCPEYCSDIVLALKVCQDVKMPLTVEALHLNDYTYPEALVRSCLDFYRATKDIKMSQI